MIFRKLGNSSWVILFGGGGREKIIKSLYDASVEVKKVFVTDIQNEKIKESLRVLTGAKIDFEIIHAHQLYESLLPFRGLNLLSIGYPHKLNAEVLSLFSIALNVHPTLLPKYRGINSGAHIIMNNESVAGSTVHLMVPEVDQGEIVLQHKVNLNRFDTTLSMQKKVYEIEPNLVLEAINLLKSGHQCISQNETDASVYRKRTPEDSEIDPTQSLVSLYDRIRSADPINYPAFFYIDNQKIFIQLFRKDKSAEEEDMI